MKDKIQNYINELRNTIMVASYNYEIWGVYKEKNSRKKYVDIMNEYSMFFQTSVHAHFVALLVALYRLYETRKDTVNIPELLKLLNENEGISKNLLYREARQLCIKVSIIRNEVFAHSSNKYNVSEVFKKAKLNPNELKELIEKTKKLLNEITQKWNRNLHLFNIEATSDTISLLDDLNELRKIRSDGV